MNNNWIDSITQTIIDSAHSPNLYHQALDDLCAVTNEFPFMQHNKLVMHRAPDIVTTDLDSNQPINDYAKIICKTTMADHLVTSPNSSMLHSGVVTTMLDSTGAFQVMANLIQLGLNNNTDIKIITKSLSKVATLDLRVDHLIPAHGKDFTASTEVLQLETTYSTTRMQLFNDENMLIAIATARFVY